MVVFIDLLSKSELGVSSLKNRADRKNKKISRPSILREIYLIAILSESGEGDGDTAKLFANLAEDFSPFVGEVLVMNLAHNHCLLSNIVLKFQTVEKYTLPKRSNKLVDFYHRIYQSHGISSNTRCSRVDGIGIKKSFVNIG